MRYRLRDLLIVTALLTVYLTVFRALFVFAVEDGAFDSYPFQTIVVSTLIVCPLMFWIIRSRELNKAAPIIFAAEPVWTWTPWNFAAAVFPAVLSLALFSLFKNRNLILSCFYGSTIGLVMIGSLMFLKVQFGCNGIVYGVSLIPWKKAKTIRSDDNTVVQYQIPPGSMIDIPTQHQSQITELCDRHS